MKLPISVCLFFGLTAPVLAAQAERIVLTDPIPLSSTLELQCSFSFKQWVGDIYVDTVNVFKQTENGVVDTQVTVEGLTYRTEGCVDDGDVKEGSIKVLVKSRFSAFWVSTGDMPWVADDYVSYKFDNYALPNCWQAEVTTKTWCASPE